MTTKTLGVVGRDLGWQKVGIELGSYVFNPNSSQPGIFQTVAVPYSYRGRQGTLSLYWTPRHPLPALNYEVHFACLGPTAKLCMT